MILVLVILGLLAAPQLADATTLHAGPIWGNDSKLCDACNVGKKDLSIKIDVVNFSGTQVNELTQVVPAGQCTAATPAANLTSGGFCRFTFSGGKKNVRAAVVSSDGSGLYIPAQ